MNSDEDFQYFDKESGTKPKPETSTSAGDEHASPPQEAQEAEREEERLVGRATEKRAGAAPPSETPPRSEPAGGHRQAPDTAVPGPQPPASQSAQAETRRAAPKPRTDNLDETAGGLVEDDSGGEPFEMKGAEKLGIVGGKGVGKSYLFQSMVYRTFSRQHSGAMTYYLENIRLFSALKRGESAVAINLAKFVKNYSRWIRLPSTTLFEQNWYRLRLHYRTGLFGRKRSAMDVEFFDGSGEGFFEMVRSKNAKLWAEGYLDARVMVFCLPLWSAFPGSNLTDKDWEDRDKILEGFGQVVENFVGLREEHGRTHPISSILALTMADDKRSALETLRDRWITPYMEDPEFYLKRLRKGSGIARYLANARKISEALHQEFAAVRDPVVASIPQRLDFNGGRPWLIPVSAVDGSFLDHLDDKEHLHAGRRGPAPVPIHVELPLLVALCERHNALI